MNGTIERLGPFNQDMPASWECIVCGVSPKRGESFVLVANDSSINTSVSITHEYLADCGILGTTGPHGESVEKA